MAKFLVVIILGNEMYRLRIEATSQEEVLLHAAVAARIFFSAEMLEKTIVTVIEEK